MTDWRRVRGLAALVGDAVEHGATGVEGVHRTLMARPFALVALIPGMEAPVKGVHVVIDRSVGAVYSMVRLGNRVVGKVAEVAIDRAERGSAEGESVEGESVEGGEADPLTHSRPERRP